jgi:excisionase family DNA binding protein
MGVPGEGESMSAKLLYRVEEAVEASGISRSTLYKLMASGALESVKVGRSRLIPHEALAAFIGDLRVEAARDRT